MKVHGARLRRTHPMLVVSNGSERGDFVPLDHVFRGVGRIHEGVQLLKTYYPRAETWSPKGRVSSRARPEAVQNAWGYEYEDYEPFDVFEEESRTRAELAEIKSWGGDVHLTLTLDLALPDEELERIVRAIRGYGRVFLRINHECNGSWFRYNRCHGYKEVSDFFLRFHRIVKGLSSSIFTVFNLSADAFVAEGTVADRFLHLGDQELGEALRAADYWSIDKYVSLHWGWPAEREVDEATGRFFRGSVDDWWRLVEETYLKMIWRNGRQAKPLFVNEFNADAAVDGEEGQARIISQVYDRIRRAELDWLAGITLYHYRDLGGLGLEVGDGATWRQTPALRAYRDAVRQFRHEPVVDPEPWQPADYSFAWSHCDDVRGVALRALEGKSRFVNELGCPAFALTCAAPGEAQEWTRLEPGAALELGGAEELLLFVPPVPDAGGVRCTTTVRNCHGSLERMVR